MYIDGNNAYKMDDIPIKSRQVATSNDLKLHHRRRAKSVKREKHVRTRKTVYIVMLAFVIAGFWTYRTVVNYGLHMQLESAEKELAMVQSTNAQTELQIQKMTDIQAVEKYAVDILGLQQPAKNQIIYLNRENSDLMGKVSSNEKVYRQGNIFKNFSASLKGFGEYFDD